MGSFENSAGPEDIGADWFSHYLVKSELELKCVCISLMSPCVYVCLHASLQAYICIIVFLRMAVCVLVF